MMATMIDNNNNNNDNAEGAVGDGGSGGGKDAIDFWANVQEEEEGGRGWWQWGKLRKEYRERKGVRVH
jgi:hypothetical protein